MTAVITPATRSRLGHLLRQREAMIRWAPGVRHIVVALDGPLDVPDVAQVLAGRIEELNLSKARNAGARAAIDGGADVLVFLDVDCIPGARLVPRYRQVASERTGLCCGMVTYLPAAPDGGQPLETLRPDPHPARPRLANDEIRHATQAEYDVFWSLSFAVNAATWARLGGFDESYVGYGGEDTDLAWRAREVGVPLWWVGGADAFHQHHPVSTPPWEHLDEILANARVFREWWGQWPMRGWLEAFAAAGAITMTEAAIRRTPSR